MAFLHYHYYRLIAIANVIHAAFIKAIIKDKKRRGANKPEMNKVTVIIEINFWFLKIFKFNILFFILEK